MNFLNMRVDAWTELDADDSIGIGFIKKLDDVWKFME